MIISTNEPEKIIAARIGNAGGVVIGLGNDENFIASDIPAILSHTNKMVFLDSEQMAVTYKGYMLRYQLYLEEVQFSR